MEDNPEDTGDSILSLLLLRAKSIFVASFYRRL
ncbi:hypothetical protein DFR58_110141 [Anaerobacterium chartisolvens]|uniref:Uncharacterized protein n=1 Tax=Anaerobacterium chartisolvens TaxID=1297424 RepID=A0A369B559_9FIRM|nr:hypothetical protein DFR58_110141 [Anaerobacterium chartisolvens]